VKRKKWLTGLVALVLLVSTALAGCSGGNGGGNTDNGGSEANAPAENTGDNTPVEGEEASAEQGYSDIMDVDWYINLSWWKYEGDWGNDAFSKYIRKNFGLNLNFVTPAGDGTDQISAMIATGEIPDLVTVESWLDYKSKLAKGGYLISYDELIEKYTPDFKPYQDVADWYRESDGKFYSLPNYAYSKHALKEGEQLEPNSGFTLRKDIYEQLGRPDISTADKFLQLLERVKNEVKTYDGKPIIPLQLYEFTSNGNQSENWLTEYFRIPYEDENGNWVNRRYDPKYEQVVKFLNEAYRKGLISKDNFTDKRDQINEKISSGRVFSQLTANQDFAEQMKALFRADNNAQYEAFPLRNYRGEDPVLTDLRGYGWMVTTVSKKSKAHERIMKMLAFLNSKEGQHLVHFGVEGESYTYNPDGTISWTPEYLELAKKDNGHFKKWGTFNMQMDWYSVKDLFPKSEIPEQRYVDEMKKPLIPYSFDTLAMNGKPMPDHPDRDRMTELENRINLFWGQELPRIIMAKSEGEAVKMWQDTLKKLDEMGQQDLNKYKNDLFQNAKQALKIERSWPPFVQK